MGGPSATGQRIMIVGQGRLELQPFEPPPPKPGELAWRTVASLVSPGTEGAMVSGLQPVQHPSPTGYATVGEVVAGDVDGYAPGDLVFSYGYHASHGVTRFLHAPVPAGLAPERAVFARLAAVAMTAVRVADIDLGEWVAVIGLGPVGNLCAQLFQLAGAEVVGIEPNAGRRALAQACGLRHVVDTGDDGGVAAVKALSGGGVRCTVEAVGASPLVHAACAMTGRLGEVIWLGSPRGEYVTDTTDILNQVHLWGNGCLTFKGAHEWRFPTRANPAARHSIEGNVHYLLKLLAEERLRVDPLLTHVLSPEQAQEAYDGLAQRKDDYVGVVFDWSRLT